MRIPPTALAIDLGSSSGKALVGTLEHGKLTTEVVYRFEHRVITKDTCLYWDMGTILPALDTALEKARELLGHWPDSVSVDTWGVDYALLDKEGKLLAPPRAYRDQRTTKVKDRFYAKISPRELFNLTGVAPQDINTVLQLMSDVELTPELARQVHRALPLPDFFLYHLCGTMGWSQGICSSTALADPSTRYWQPECLQAAGIPASWLGNISPEKTKVGMSPTGVGVFRAGSHDTACAINALPIDASTHPMFISCGSWSLAGACTDHAITSDGAWEAGLTNETRCDGGNRLLNNMSGMWIFQECIRQWEKEGKEVSYKSLDQGALRVSGIDFVIDPGDESLMGPDQMPRKVVELVRRTHGDQAAALVSDPYAITRLINHSLAVAHGRTMKALESLAGLNSERIYMVGGGINNRALCQYTADCTGKTVVAGPVEASAVGNLLAQFEANGALSSNERANVVAASFEPITYRPDVNSQVARLV